MEIMRYCLLFFPLYQWLNFFHASPFFFFFFPSPFPRSGPDYFSHRFKEGQDESVVADFLFLSRLRFAKK